MFSYLYYLITAVIVHGYCEDGTVCNNHCITPDSNGDCVKGMIMNIIGGSKGMLINIIGGSNYRRREYSFYRHLSINVGIKYIFLLNNSC